MSDYYALEKRVSVIEGKLDEITKRMDRNVKAGKGNAENKKLAEAVIRYLRECGYITAEYLNGQSTQEAFGEFAGWCRMNGVEFPRDKGGRTVFSNAVRGVVKDVDYSKGYFRAKSAPYEQNGGDEQ